VYLSLVTHRHYTFRDVNTEQQLDVNYITYLFTFPGSNNVDNFRVGVDKENVFRLQVGVRQLVGM